MIKDRFTKVFVYTVLVIGAIITIAPFLWMLSTSLKPFGEVFQMPPKLLPSKFMWNNYLEVQERIPIIRFFFNSFTITLGVTAGTLITTILAAFGFSRIKFWGRDVIFSIFIGTMIIPGEVILIPNYITISKLGWINTYKGLIIPWTISVFSVFLLRQFFLTVPEALYKAAKIDGCSDFKFLWKVMVPVSKPALITIALLKIINSWNEFLWPLIITNIPEMRTLPVALMTFTSEAGNDYHLLMAAATIIITPMIIIYFVLQKYIISGITKSGIKG
ncbi:carbohydrate ABC transporter permease [Clostridium frigidicarnis]|uniref:Carbohydrate ABC transporter membrane protein 2, CUT1 family n=1 Tax=Clostridium frigidicarnis TaxID=84698 RepID=A0A1I0XG95_9CLOT|nr:carbohydrate ABC transporter permease [Clostridium frigidicarnis]SFB00011.1 carbohydrate ABC transporter membrane protein 2, CUT1 family [Clostridium frigidicarnis]